MSLYATTHEECVTGYPVSDYIKLHQACGGRSSSGSVAHKDGCHSDEWPGAWATASDATVMGAVEIRRYWHGTSEPALPECIDGIDNDGDGFPNFGDDAPDGAAPTTRAVLSRGLTPGRASAPRDQSPRTSSSAPAARARSRSASLQDFESGEICLAWRRSFR